MDTLTLQDIQQVSYGLLERIHAFCISNGIRYSLAYGSLIGAVRHKGFIPWDDDIDIVMPRPDFEKFCMKYRAQGTLLVPPSNSKSMVAYARVCDSERTIVTGQCWLDDTVGVWVDIFPLDGAPADESYVGYYLKAHHKWRRILYYRELLTQSQLWYGKKLKIGISIVHIFHLSHIVSFFIHWMVVRYLVFIQRNAFGSSDRCTQLTCPNNGSGELWLCSDFDDIIEMQFGDGRFCVVRAYDRVLTSTYGDYMKLPPLEERKPKQSDMVFQWLLKTDRHIRYESEEG